MVNLNMETGYKGGGYDPYNSATTSKRWINRRFGYFAGGILRLIVAVFSH